MEFANTIQWLYLFGFAYLAITLFWAHNAAKENRNFESYFSAGHSLAPWVGAVLIAGASVSSWFILGSAEIIARDGFVHSNLLQAGVLLAIPGVLFYKWAWFVAQRYRVSSQIELFRLYYDSDMLVVVGTIIALLFAIGFSGIQLYAISNLISTIF